MGRGISDDYYLSNKYEQDISGWLLVYLGTSVKIVALQSPRCVQFIAHGAEINRFHNSNVRNVRILKLPREFTGLPFPNL